MPMRTAFTASASTAMWCRPVAITVSGSSTTTRAGESRALSLGVTEPFALISTRTVSASRTTLTRSSWLGVWAATATTITSSNDTKIVTCCFRISPLPTRGPGPRVLLATRFRRSGFRIAVLLNRRGEDSLHHFPRKRLAQLVLDGFLEHHRVSRDLHHVSVKHGIVFAQEISLVQVVRNHRNEARVGLHHAPQVDRANFQALLSGRTAGPGLLHNRTEERITLAVHRPLLVFPLGWIGRFRHLHRRRRSHRRSGLRGRQDFGLLRLGLGSRRGFRGRCLYVGNLRRGTGLQGGWSRRGWARRLRPWSSGLRGRSRSIVGHRGAAILGVQDQDHLAGRSGSDLVRQGLLQIHNH